MKGLRINNLYVYVTVEDLEMNDGSPDKPYFMSKGMMKILGKKNKQLKEPQNGGAAADGKAKKGKQNLDF